MSPDGVRLKVGSQVKIMGFPRPTDPNNSIIYDGQIGMVVKVIPMDMMRGGSGYSYEVEFKDMEMNYSELDPNTRRLVRGKKIITVRNIFHEGYVDLVALPPAPAPLAPRAPAIPDASIQSDSKKFEEPVSEEKAEVSEESKISVPVSVEPAPKQVPTIKLGTEGPPKVDPNTDMEVLRAKIRAEIEAEMRQKGK